MLLHVLDVAFSLATPHPCSGDDGEGYTREPLHEGIYEHTHIIKCCRF
jgi:hypothetical protein